MTANAPTPHDLVVMAEELVSIAKKLEQVALEEEEGILDTLSMKCTNVSMRARMAQQHVRGLLQPELYSGQEETS